MVSVSTDDLATLLDIDPASFNTARGQLLLDLATSLATAVVSPLPDGAEAVIYTMAARGYTNPTGVSEQTVGPESVAYSAASAGFGVYLTDEDKATLELLGGSGGGFTINMQGPDVGKHLPWWDRNVWGIPGIERGL